jgi:hypothetical protein
MDIAAVLLDAKGVHGLDAGCALRRDESRQSGECGYIQ